jgi:predicted transcriptional regulator
MSVNTVNISFQKDLLDEIDSVAREESRSRSEVLREAARMYIDKKKRWKDIFALGDRVRAESGITEEDIIEEIRKDRRGGNSR